MTAHANGVEILPIPSSTTTKVWPAIGTDDTDDVGDVAETSAGERQANGTSDDLAQGTPRRLDILTSLRTSLRKEVCRLDTCMVPREKYQARAGTKLEA